MWLAKAEQAPYGPLSGDLSVDVCVVGGGITGLTCALDLAREGRSVAVLEAGALGAGVTGHTTGKVTALHGLIYDELERGFGPPAAAGYAAAQLAALDQIAA